jgi:asparagine synthase (glutamine-hydrolysing)
MCGFCGLISNSAEADVSLISAMLRPLAQRGPDAAGLYAQQSLALGHRRLSILDLAATSQQPMLDSELGIGVAFNGCIYNFESFAKNSKPTAIDFSPMGTPRSLSKPTMRGVQTASNASWACSRSRSGSAIPVALSWPETGSE